jgi:aryl-alcohol dehydrogenase-like predicted oxidoreductase
MSDSTLPLRRLGARGPEVGAVALGAMGLSPMYGPVDEPEGIATVQAALDSGARLIDTGDFYASGHNELLIARALRGRRDQAVLSVKFGALRDPAGGWIGVDNRPVAVKNALAYTLKRLGVDHIDIYRPARLDPNVPIEDTVGAIADLIRAGYVRHLGLSEVGAATVRRAHAVHPVADLQIEYSIASRGIEPTLLPTLRELGIGVTAYGALSRGLLAGSKPAGPADYRAHLPRFQGEAGAHNRQLAGALGAFAAARGTTVARLALGWVLARGDDIVPLLGARRPTQWKDGAASATQPPSAEDLASLETLFDSLGVKGTRYDTAHMAMLDSERR